MARPTTDRIYLSLIGVRLEKLLKLLGWSPARLADYLGYSSPDQVHRCFRGETFIRIDKLARLAQVETDSGKVRCNLHWLLTGEGTPLLEYSLDAELVRLDPEHQEVAEYLIEKLGYVRALHLAKSIRTAPEK